jgi:hypothetical protein
VKIAEFEPLAKCIAQFKKPRIKVPPTLSSALDRAIKMRKRHQDLYQAWPPVSAEQQDGHAHMILVLENVRDILRSITPAPVQARRPDPGIPSGADAVNNRFEHLAIEETVESAGTPGDSRDPATAPRKFTADLGASKEEAQVAAAYFYCDLHRIREFINVLWTQYEKGKMDLAVVSLTTNTAIDLARDLYEEFEVDFGAQVQLEDLDCFCCVTPKALQRQDDLRSYGICMNSSRLLLRDRLEDRLQDSSDYVPTVRKDFMKIIPGQSTDVPPTDLELYRHDVKIAMGVIPEYLVLACRDTKAIQAEHNIIRGLRILFQERTLPRWLEFGLQIYLDIRRILGENVTRGFAHLRREVRTISTRIETVLAADPQLSPDKSSSSIHTSLSNVLDLVHRWTDTDYVDRIRRDIQLDESISDSYPAYYLLERDPLLCGLLLYNFRTVAHEGAIVLANHGRYIQATAHLYNCLQQSELQEYSWIDLEILFQVQDVRNIFVGERPKNIQDCAKAFGLAFGLSPASLKSFRRKAPLKFSLEKSRKLQTSGRTLWWFKKRYCDSDGRVNITSGDVEHILHESGICDFAEAHIEGTPSTSQLLILLAETLGCEVAVAQFDFFEMHLVCLRILQLLEESVGPEIPDWIRFGRDDKPLACFVLSLLSEIAQPEIPGVINDGLLFRTARIVFDVITQEGGMRVVTKSMPGSALELDLARERRLVPQ